MSLICHVHLCSSYGQHTQRFTLLLTLAQRLPWELYPLSESYLPAFDPFIFIYYQKVYNAWNYLAIPASNKPVLYSYCYSHFWLINDFKHDTAQIAIINKVAIIKLLQLGLLTSDRCEYIIFHCMCMYIIYVCIHIPVYTGVYTHVSIHSHIAI